MGPDRRRPSLLNRLLRHRSTGQYAMSLVRWESTAGAEDWERLQNRQRTLSARLPLSQIEPLDEPQTWETDLTEVWQYGGPGEAKKSMQVRLEEMLKVNPLDYEQKPFSERTVTSVADGKTTDGTMMNVRCVAPAAL